MSNTNHWMWTSWALALSGIHLLLRLSVLSCSPSSWTYSNMKHSCHSGIAYAMPNLRVIAAVSKHVIILFGLKALAGCFLFTATEEFHTVPSVVPAFLCLPWPPYQSIQQGRHQCGSPCAKLLNTFRMASEKSVHTIVVHLASLSAQPKLHAFFHIFSHTMHMPIQNISKHCVESTKHVWHVFFNSDTQSTLRPRVIAICTDCEQILQDSLGAYKCAAILGALMLLAMQWVPEEN